MDLEDMKKEIVGDEKKYKHFESYKFSILAFLFGGYYFAYRKMLVFGILVCIIQSLLISALASVSIIATCAIWLLIAVGCGFGFPIIYRKKYNDLASKVMSMQNGKELLNRNAGTKVLNVIIVALVIAVITVVMGAFKTGKSAQTVIDENTNSVEENNISLSVDEAIHKILSASDKPFFEYFDVEKYGVYTASKTETGIYCYYDKVQKTDDTQKHDIEVKTYCAENNQKDFEELSQALNNAITDTGSSNIKQTATRIAGIQWLKTEFKDIDGNMYYIYIHEINMVEYVIEVRVDASHIKYEPKTYKENASYIPLQCELLIDPELLVKNNNICSSTLDVTKLKTNTNTNTVDNTNTTTEDTNTTGGFLISNKYEGTLTPDKKVNVANYFTYTEPTKYSLADEARGYDCIYKDADSGSKIEIFSTDGIYDIGKLISEYKEYNKKELQDIDVNGSKWYVFVYDSDPEVIRLDAFTSFGGTKILYYNAEISRNIEQERIDELWNEALDTLYSFKEK